MKKKKKNKQEIGFPLYKDYSLFEIVQSQRSVHVHRIAS